MTLVLTCLSPKYVIQVSDRRLTWLTGPNKGKEADDKTNKAVVACNRLVVGYSGLAKIGGQKTDDWILAVVSSVTPYSVERIKKTLAERATKSFEKIKFPSKQKRHAFMISGWARFDSRDAPLTPFVSIISNAHDFASPKWLDEAQNEFKTGFTALGNRPYFLAAVGQPIKTATLNRLNRQIFAYVSRERGPEAYIQLLASAIRETAGYFESVGKNLMAVSLPAAAAKPGGSMAMTIPLGGQLPATEPLALYLPDGDDPMVYGPHYTCNGMLIKGFESTRA
jgi:hypothetical protein